MFDVVEQLKKEWTDKYVVVSSPAPELARFANATGTVKTVNMNGRCLVEFDQYNNIGWYDIDPSFLKIVPKPLPKPVEAKEKPAKAAAPAKAATPAKPAAAKPASGKPSTADILAAARGKAGGATPAAAKPAAGKPSTADILAMARAKKAATEAAAPAAEAPADEAVEAVAEAPSPKAAAPKKAAAGALPTTTAEKIAWCRKNDAKS
jgi:hypothetical protein